MFITLYCRLQETHVKRRENESLIIIYTNSEAERIRPFFSLIHCLCRRFILPICITDMIVRRSTLILSFLITLTSLFYSSTISCLSNGHISNNGRIPYRKVENHSIVFLHSIDFVDTSHYV